MLGPSHSFSLLLPRRYSGLIAAATSRRATDAIQAEACFELWLLSNRKDTQWLTTAQQLGHHQAQAESTRSGYGVSVFKQLGVECFPSEATEAHTLFAPQAKTDSKYTPCWRKGCVRRCTGSKEDDLKVRLRKCSRCMTAKYCSTLCQIADWKSSPGHRGHREDCTPYSLAKFAFLL